jgi:hypothetical protein
MKNVVIAVTETRRLRAYIVTMWNRVDMKKVARMCMDRPNRSNGPDQYRNGSCPSATSAQLDISQYSPA